jgi:hypothetical protein
MIHRSGPGSFFGHLEGFFPLPERRYALLFKASTVAMWGLLHLEMMRHDISEEPARRDRTRVPPLCLDGPTKKYAFINPRTNSARPRNTQKSKPHFEHFQTAIARTGRYE